MNILLVLNRTMNGYTRKASANETYDIFIFAVPLAGVPSTISYALKKIRPSQMLMSAYSNGQRSLENHQAPRVPPHTKD
jgi:hypothetical protein